MSLLCVTVRRAKLCGNDAQFNTYVTLKLQNVKSTTVTVKGANPQWEQDFMFETNRMDTGLVIELWNKGLLWDKLIGTYWLPLMGIQFATEVGEGQWLSIDAELVMKDGEICGTHTPTGHIALIEAHFEPPYELQIDDVSEFSRKLEMLNSYMEQELVAFHQQEQIRVNHHPNTLYSEISQDSDYTSDVNFPIQHPSINVSLNTHHMNSSASQFGGASNITQRLTDYGNENDGTAYGMFQQNEYDHRNDDETYHNSRFAQQYSDENEPLSYNSRPSRRMLPQISDKMIHNKPNFQYNSTHQSNQNYTAVNHHDYVYSDDVHNSSDLHLHKSVNDSSQWNDTHIPHQFQKMRPPQRRPSLERQGGFDQIDENYMSEYYNQANNVSFDEENYDNSAKNSEQFYSVDESFRQDSYESYANSIGIDNGVDFENEITEIAPQNTSPTINRYGVPQEQQNNWSFTNNTEWTNEANAQSIHKQRILPQLLNQRNQKTNNSFELENNANEFDIREEIVDSSVKKKELWKNSSKSESTLWQTVSNDDTFEDKINLQNKNEKQSPPYFTPKSSVDYDDIPKPRKDSLDRQSTGETIPADDIHVIASPPSLAPLSSTIQPLLPSVTHLPHSAIIKYESRPSGEPKTVTFSDDISHHVSPPLITSNNSELISLSKTETNIPSSLIGSSTRSDGLSRARVRWITAFNKITNDLTERYMHLRSSYAIKSD